MENPDKIIIANLPGLDGTYEFDFADLFGTLTNGDFHTIKTISGLRSSEIEEAFEAKDTDLAVAFVVIFFQRRNLQVDLKRLWDAPIGSLKILIGDRDGQSPPAEPATSQHGAVAAAPPTSGDGSTSTSASPETAPSPSGSPGSESPATSDLAISPV